MLITLRVMKLNKDIKIEVQPGELIKSVRERVAAQLDVNPFQLKIIANAKILKNEQTVAECHICESTKISVAITKATTIETKPVAPIQIQAADAANKVQHEEPA